MAQIATLTYLTLVQAHCQNKFVIDTTQLRTLTTFMKPLDKIQFLFLQTQQFSKMNHLQGPRCLFLHVM
jgi:hypothetical protein